MEIDMKDMWQAWPAGLSKEYCDYVVDKCKQIPSQNGFISTDGNLNSDVRRSTIRWLDVQGAHNDIAQTIMRFVHTANRNNFGFDLWAMNEIQFTEYHGTQNGKYDWHHDVFWDNPQPFDRKLSFILQLSDPADYEGGEFEFFGGIQAPGELFKPRGSVLVFPSFFTHRVLPVTSGERNSLVSWVEGPKFR
jgi:PKHD-type hydroxylase